MLNTRQILRSLHTTIPCLARNRGRRSNVGVGKQLQLYGNADELDTETYDEMESDFMQAHKTHREYEREILQHRENVRHLMVKNKYFRGQKMPNLLTYAEKEQMRLLHSRDPEEWTAERLAESFPATPEIVLKILRAKWQPRSAERVRAHDENVIHNWEQLRAGKNEWQLPQELFEHLQKFTIRKREDFPPSEWTPRELPKPKQQEFLSLITSCSKYAEKEAVPQLTAKDTKPTPHNSNDADAETFLLDKVQDRRRMRLQELKQLKLQTNDELSRPSLEQRAAAAFDNPNGTGILPTAANTTTAVAVDNKTHLADLGFAQKFESSEIVINVEDQRRYEMSSAKDHVHIPRKVWRKGATYRVEDSYYDDDGEFLYRVPGMTGKVV